MKTEILLFLTSILIGIAQSANAGIRETPVKPPQTDACGANVAQVNGIINSNSKFVGVFKANYVDSFIGKWGTAFPLIITASDKFHFYGSDYVVCPQEDKTFYVYKVGDPLEGGYLKLDSENQITFFDGKGLLSEANGPYNKGT